MPTEIQVSGPAGHLCTLSLDPGATVSELKDAIVRQTDIGVHSQRLFHGGTELTNAERIPALGSDDQEHVELLLIRRTPEQAGWLQELDNTSDISVISWLRAAPPAAQADRTVVLFAVQKQALALECAASELRADREVVLTAVRAWGPCLQWAARELRADREVVLTAVKAWGPCLQWASRELRANREVVLAAVEQNGRALEHAAPSLRADLEVARAAVQFDAAALEFIDPHLRSDRQVMLATWCCCLGYGTPTTGLLLIAAVILAVVLASFGIGLPFAASVSVAADATVARTVIHSAAFLGGK